ncbi:N-acetyltransferase [Selenomonas sp.]|uniref:N-acetyltransferase n=1 Tax=Selenomonas sp. TaxID=2053611 RepID=UPI0034500147
MHSKRSSNRLTSKIVAKTVDEIHRRDGTVTASCTYAKAWLERHPQKEDSIS